MNIALVLSGGTGTRLGSDIPKQYIKVNGQMIISYCLTMFANHQRIDGIQIVCSSEWEQAIIDELTSLGINTDKIIGFSAPGVTRQTSILNGLRDIVAKGYGSDTTVIIHDGARPNLTFSYVDFCLDSLAGHDGVMPALPMKDTVYMSEDGKIISALLDRSKIYAGQAPELYILGKYLAANEALLPDDILKINGSTEPAVMAGLDVAIIKGDENNYKITTQADLEKFRDSVN